MGADRLRVVWITDYYTPWTPGGSTESVRLLARAVRSWASVVIVTPQWHPGAPLRDEVDGVRVVRFPVPARVPFGPHVAPEHVAARRVSRRHARQALLATLTDHAPRLVHAQDRRFAIPALDVARRASVPALVTLRDPGALCPLATCFLDHTEVPRACSAAMLRRRCAAELPALSRLTAVLRYHRLRREQRRLDEAAALVFVSEGLRRAYASAAVFFGTDRETAAVIPSPVEPLPDGLAVAEPADVLFVGKASPGKGWPDFAALATALPSARCVQIGLRPVVSSPSVRSLGVLDHDHTLARMRTARVVVVPSRWCDALPRVALEAAVLARPVVATRVGGLAEIVQDGRTGLLVSRGDVSGLIGATRSLLDHPETARAMGRAAQADVLDRFGLDAVGRRLHALYDRVLP